jgi:Putative auto-transporter adhesin, head GIN domain
VGNIQLAGGDCDSIELNLPGAGNIAVTGKAKELTAHLSGVGSLDARQLTAETLNLNLSGMSSANVAVKQTANVDMSGIGSVTVYGQPANRRVRMNGIGKVIWK